MAGSFVNVEVDTTKLIDALKRLKDKTDDLKPMLNDLGEGLLLWHMLRNTREITPDGIKWQQLAPSTIAKKKRNKDKILVERGLLLSFLDYYVEGNDTLIFGPIMKYGAIHQFGGTIHHNARSQRAYFKVDKETGRSRFARKDKANFEQRITIGAHDTVIPARPYIGIARDGLNGDVDDVLDVIKRHLKLAIEKAS